jgi:hypothetical protein
MNLMMMMIVTVLTFTVTMSRNNHVVAEGCNVCTNEGAACDDPHLVGFDGKMFDIWKAGDYLVLRESDGFEVWFTVSYRWSSSAPYITEIRCRGPGGPWMKVSTLTGGSNHSTVNGTVEATVFVDGVGAAVDNGGKYTDSTSSLQVKKSLQGSSIEFVAPRWRLYVQHKIAHVIRDGWHYLNMEVEITSMLETPVTGVLGATYNPETYSHILHQEANETSPGVVDHSSASRALKRTLPLMPRGLLIHPAAAAADDDDDDDGSSTSTLILRKLMAQQRPCCNGVPYNPSTEICCRGIKRPRRDSKTECCGDQAYSTHSEVCCDNVTMFVVSSISGISVAQTACCGNQSYALSHQMCCDNVKTFVVSPKPPAIQGTLACCGEKVYSTNYDVCCQPGNIVQKPPCP